MVPARLFTLIAAVAFVALAPAGTAVAAPKKPACSVKGSKTVTSNRYARVFTLRSKQEDFGDVLYGCLRSSGRRVRLSAEFDDGLYSTSAFTKVGLSGRFVVWQLNSVDTSCKADCPPGYEPSVFRIGVADLRSRRVTGYPGAARDVLLVTRTGIPAWVQQAGDLTEVHAGTQVLDSGAIGDIALNGLELSWYNAGSQHSATLR
jgi:hypothetical protein